MNTVRKVPGMRKIDKIHFVGIGGAGMCGIAEVLQTQGYTVTGSDLKFSANTDRLSDLGVTVFEGHDIAHVQGADVVVTSTAVSTDNPEVLWAKANRVPVVQRAKMLAELMRYRHGVAVAGTHGKTTTTSMIASIFAAAKLDPTFIIGGLVNNFGSNARLGESRYLIVEADESDASFLHLQPMSAVITNIESDHMSTYDGDLSKLKDTFLAFTNNLPFYGAVVLCIDDPIVRIMSKQFGRATITYGFSPDADVRITNLTMEGGCSQFTVETLAGEHMDIQLNVPGKHNVLNATAAIALCLDEGLEVQAIKQGLAEFEGVGRRFQVYGDFPLEEGSVHLVDDYGHHPTELKATIDAARVTYPDRRLVMIFQPHRYSRTHDLYDEFVEVLAQVDQLILLDVYSAGEAPIPGADSISLSKTLQKYGGQVPVHVKSVDKVKDVLKRIVTHNDIVMTQGAGNVGSLAESLAREGFL